MLWNIVKVLCVDLRGPPVAYNLTV